MSDPYERATGGRLSFKGGTLATRTKTIDKNKSKKKKKKKDLEKSPEVSEDNVQNKDEGIEEGGGEVVYTIDAAKRMKYEQLFPVETKKFGYDSNSNSKSIEDALDDRVKKKADRYCK